MLMKGPSRAIEDLRGQRVESSRRGPMKVSPVQYDKAQAKLMTVSIKWVERQTLPTGAFLNALR